jgi:hypothetical protein
MTINLNDKCTGKELPKEQFESLGLSSSKIVAKNSFSFTIEEKRNG